MLWFVLSAAGIYAVVGGAALILIRLLPGASSKGEAFFPPAFWVSTCLLIAVSVALHRGVYFVRLERQKNFRKSLLTGLACGAAFVAIQSYGLSCMIRHQAPDDVETGSNAFLTMLAALHAMHVTLALMLLIWVTLNAHFDRYDHEYYLGATFCAWFWHGLGIVWMMIMVVFLIATNFGPAREPAKSAGRPQSAEHVPAAGVPFRPDPLTLRAPATTIHTDFPRRFT